MPPSPPTIPETCRRAAGRHRLRVRVLSRCSTAERAFCLVPTTLFPRPHGTSASNQRIGRATSPPRAGRRGVHLRDRHAGPAFTWGWRRRFAFPALRVAAASSCTSPPSGSTGPQTGGRPGLGLDPTNVLLASSASAGRRGRGDNQPPVHCCILAAAQRCRPVKMLVRRGRNSFFVATSTATRHLHLVLTPPLPTSIIIIVVSVPARRRLLRVHFVGRACECHHHTPGPYACENSVVDAGRLRTNNPPWLCDARIPAWVRRASPRGPMDKLRRPAALDPVDIRLRNAMLTCYRLITGQGRGSRGVGPPCRCLRGRGVPMPTEPVGARRRPHAPTWRRRSHPPTWQLRPRRRLRRGHQEPHVLRRVRRLTPTAACRLSDGGPAPEFATPSCSRA